VRDASVEIVREQSVFGFGRPGAGTQGAPSGEAGEQATAPAP
jgi:hypothetical protein